MTIQLLLATRNAHKVGELRAMLGDLPGLVVFGVEDFEAGRCGAPERHGPVPDPDETGTTFAENARLKARAYAEATGMLALADDSGLVVDALDGRPGVYSSRYAATDGERIARLLAELGDTPPAQRSARFVCAMAIASPDAVPPRIVGESEGRIEGHIAHEPRGQHGFGYDPIFVSTELAMHLAEATPDQKNAISHRGRALSLLRPVVQSLLTRP